MSFKSNLGFTSIEQQALPFYLSSSKEDEHQVETTVMDSLSSSINIAIFMEFITVQEWIVSRRYLIGH